MLCLLLLLKHQVCDDLNVDCSNIHWLVTRTRKGYYLNNTKGTNTDTAGTNSGILEGFKKPLGHWSDQTSYIYRWWSSYIPPFPLYTAVSPIMSFQFVTGCYFPDKNKYYWKGGGWVVVVGVISYFYWTINLDIRPVRFPLNNRTFERQNSADCANISQEISVTISGLNTVVTLELNINGEVMW